jgi:uncharacterized protein (TIGR02217 family)
MTLLASRLSARIERGAERRVSHPSRVKHVLPNGRVKFVFQSGTLKHYFNVSHGIHTIEDYFEVMSAFYVVMGEAYDGLLMRDWSDFRATITNTTVVDLGGGDYQLARFYPFGGQEYVRNITRPVNDGNLAVFDSGGSPLTPTVDYTTGQFTVASGTPDNWSGLFDVPVSFVDDDWSAVQEASESGVLMVAQPIELEEILE